VSRDREGGQADGTTTAQAIEYRVDPGDSRRNHPAASGGSSGPRVAFARQKGPSPDPWAPGFGLEVTDQRNAGRAATPSLFGGGTLPSEDVIGKEKDTSIRTSISAVK
jgi:hypothetical protein